MFQLIRFEFKQLLSSWLFYGFLLITCAVSFQFFYLLSISYTYTSTINSYLGVYNLFTPAFGITAFFISYLFAMLFLRDSDSKFDKILLSLPIPSRNIVFSKMIVGFAQVCLFIAIILISFNIFMDYFLNKSVKTEYNQWSVYFYYITYIFMPNLMFSVGLILLIAVKLKNILSTLIVYIIVSALILLPPIIFSYFDLDLLASLSDIKGNFAILEFTQYWSKLEQSVYNPYDQLPLLINRIITISISLILIYVTILHVRKAPSDSSNIDTSLEVSTFDSKMTQKTTLNNKTPSWFWMQFVSQIKLDLQSIILKKWFWQSLITIFVAGIVICSEIESAFGAVGLKTSYSIFTQYASITFIVFPMLAVVFSGLLFSNEKSNHVFFLIQSSNNSPLLWLFSKWVGVCLVMIMFSTILLFSGITVQIFSGQLDFDGSLYFFGFIFYLTFQSMLWAAVAIFFQVIVRQTIISIVLILIVSTLWKKYLFLGDFMSAPSLYYSTLNGWSGNLTGWVWFNFMWLLIAITLLVIVAPLVKKDFKSQFNIFKLFNNTRNSMKQTAIVTVLCCLSSVLVFKNYMNEAKSSHGFDYKTTIKQRADYEKTFKSNIDAPILSITDWSGKIDLFASLRQLDVTAQIVLHNDTNESINEVLLFWDVDKTSSDIHILNEDIIASTDKHNVSTLTFNQTIQPNQSVTIKYTLDYSPAEYSYHFFDSRLIKNGTFLNSELFIPELSVIESKFIQSEKTRNKFDLGKLKSRYNQLNANRDESNFHGKNNKVNFDFIVSTDDDQYITMPGKLIKQWEQNNRQYFHYKPSQPIANFANLTSGKYKIKTSKWNEVDLQIQYSANHGQNIDTIFDSMQDSLTYFDQHYSPYQHEYLRVIETPEYYNFAQSYVGTVPFSTTMGFNSNSQKHDAVNLAYFVTAHEIAHQWWGKQLIPAKSIGSQFLSESLSQLSAYQVVQHNLGRTQTRLLNKDSQNSFSTSVAFKAQFGGGEGTLIKPGIRDQDLYYSKAIFSLAQISYMIGEDNVNATLKELIEIHGNRNDNFATSTDFMNLLRKNTPSHYKASVRKTLTRRIRYENRIESADVTLLDDGRYQLDIVFESESKSYTDQSEREDLMNYPIEITAFAQHPDDSESKWEDNQLSSIRIDMNKGDATHPTAELEIVDTHSAKLTLRLDEKPKWIAIDPEYLYLDRNLDDNYMKIK